MTEEMKTFTQDEVNVMMGKVREEATTRANRKHEVDSVEQKRKAEETRLAENQEFKELAEKRGLQVAELEAYKEQVGKYQKIMQGDLDSKLEELGDDAKKAVKDLKGVAAKLDWLNKNKSLFVATDDGVGSPVRPKKSGGPKKTKYKSRGI